VRTRNSRRARATVDFPDLPPGNNAAARELRAALGRDYLKADVFKLSHHVSKHGVTLELVERVSPSITLVSSVGRRGKHNVPHHVAIESTREALQPTTTRSTRRRPDEDLGIHYTGARLDTPEHPALGTIGIVVRPGRAAPRLFRFFDGAEDAIELASAREVR
jgi:hypothetical protein